MAREPNGSVEPVPANYVGVPDEVRATSDEYDQARRRYFDLRNERAGSEESVRQAQSVDVEAVRGAVAAGKEPPKPKAQAAVEAATQLDRKTEAARSLAIEAEDRYVNACRAHRSEWMDALQQARDSMQAREQRAIEEVRQARLDVYNAETAYREIEALGEPSPYRNARNAQVVLNFRTFRKLDPDDERRLSEFHEGRDSRFIPGGLMAA